MIRWALSASAEVGEAIWLSVFARMMDSTFDVPTKVGAAYDAARSPPGVPVTAEPGMAMVVFVSPVTRPWASMVVDATWVAVPAEDAPGPVFLRVVNPRVPVTSPAMAL